MKQYAANWILAITPGLIYPLLAFAYYLQHKGRRGQIRDLLNLSDVRQAYDEAFGHKLKAHAKVETDQAKQAGGLEMKPGAAAEQGGEGEKPSASVGSKQGGEGNKPGDVIEKAVLDDDPLRLDVKSWIIPLAISVLTAVAGTAVCMIQAGRGFGLGASLESWIQTHASPFAAAGFAGGYLWGLYDLLDRFGILNWTPESIHWVYFRLALGPVLGGYISSLANPQIGGFLAFAVAAFPTGAIRERIEALARSKLNLPDSTEPSAKPKWELIQGLTPDIIDRLKRGGVSSAAHLANEDPMRLLRVTNIEWRNILDMLDQAYLAVYVEEKIERLRPLGIRGSVEMGAVYDRAQSNNKDRKERAEAVIVKIGEVLQTEPVGAMNLARMLAHDPVVGLLKRLWFGDSLSEDGTYGRETTTMAARQG
jgi:hypothetical protein